MGGDPRCSVGIGGYGARDNPVAKDKTAVTGSGASSCFTFGSGFASHCFETSAEPRQHSLKAP